MNINAKHNDINTLVLNVHCSGSMSHHSSALSGVV